MWIAFGLAVFLVFGLSLLIGRSISKAIGSMVAAMTRLAGGDVRTAIPGLGRNDEIGEMASAVEVFKNSMVESDGCGPSSSRPSSVRRRSAKPT
jgi:methyl-accepting chemotaxis protein